MNALLNIEQRNKDVLFALYSAAQNNCPKLGRLPLQKTIYLFDVLVITWRQVAAMSKFRSYHNGPYDATIQNCVDALTFRGFVEVDDLKIKKTKNVECQYKLTEIGLTCVENLAKEEGFNDDLLLYLEISKEINRRGWKNIKKIVYSEPTYNMLKNKRSKAIPLSNPSENLSTQIITALEETYIFNYPESVKRKMTVQIFFAILDEYRKNQKHLLATD